MDEQTGITGADIAGAAGGAGDIIDTTTASFMADVIEASREQVVLVDFWAPWCEPCRQLTPLLEKLTQEAGGQIRLAKMNIDEHPQIAQQLRVQSIPAIFAFKDGQPIDGFMGALPESELRAFLEKQLGGALSSAVGAHLTAAQEAMGAGDFALAIDLYSAILDEQSEHLEAQLGLTQAYMASDVPEAARAILNDIKPQHQTHPDFLALTAQLDLADKTSNMDSPSDLSDLEARLTQNPQDHQARFDYALACHAQGQSEAALDALLTIIETAPTWNDEAARKQLIELFDAYGAEDELVITARRRLSTILFR